MSTVSDRALALHYAEAGSGGPLIFLTGLAGDHLYWMSQMRAFAGRYRCFALDLRDAGQSPYATGPYTIVDLAEDVFRVMEELQLPPAHLVGMSLGSMIAQELALHHPDRVRSLFLAGTLGQSDGWFQGILDVFCAIRRPAASTSEFFQTLLPLLVSHRFFEDPGRVEWLRALFAQAPYPQRIDGFIRQIDAIRGHDTLQRLPGIRCPVCVAVGENDLIAPPRYGRQVAKRVPHARLEILANVGHAPPIENGRAFNQLLNDFLAEVDANLAPIPPIPNHHG